MVSGSSWIIAELSGSSHVAVLPILAQRFAVIFAKQSQLHGLIARRSFTELFTAKCKLFSNESGLYGYKSSLSLVHAQLQQPVHRLLTFGQLLAIIAGLFTHIQLSVVESLVLGQWYQYVFTDQCLFAHLVQFLAEFGLLLTFFALLFPHESLLFAHFPGILAHLALLLANITHLHAGHSLLFAQLPQLLGLATLFAGIPGLLPNGHELLAHLTQVFTAVAIVRRLTRITAVHTRLATIFSSFAEIFSHLSAVFSDVSTAFTGCQSVQSDRIELLGHITTLLAQYADIFA